MNQNDVLCPVCKLSDTIKKLDTVINDQDEILFQRATQKMRRKVGLWKFFTGQTILGKQLSGLIIIGIPSIIFFCSCAFVGTPISQAFASINVSENVLIFAVFIIFLIYLFVVSIIASQLINRKIIENVPELIMNLNKGIFYYCSRDDIVFNVETEKYSKPEDILEIV